MILQRTHQGNDCGVCALVNATHLLGIPLDYGTAIGASKYDREGYGSSYWGVQWLIKHYPIERECWPYGDDWPMPIKDYEADTTYLWNGLRDRLLDGWVGISAQQWNDHLYHAIVFSEYKDDKITVLCSMRGVYQIDREWLKWKGKFQPVIFTEWLRCRAVLG